MWRQRVLWQRPGMSARPLRNRFCVIEFENANGKVKSDVFWYFEFEDISNFHIVEARFWVGLSFVLYCSLNMRCVQMWNIYLMKRNCLNFSALHSRIRINNDVIQLISYRFSSKRYCKNVNEIYKRKQKKNFTAIFNNQSCVISLEILHCC